MKENTQKKTGRFSKHKKRLMLWVAGLFLFSVSTSVTATFAWYTINREFSIEHLNIHIGSIDTTLLLGIRGQDGEIIFKDEYTKEDLDLSHDALDQVSAMYSSEWLDDETKSNDEKMPEFRSAYRFGTDKGKTAYAQEGFVRKEFFFKSSQDCSLYLSDESYVVPNIEKNQKTVETYGDVTLEGLNEAVNSLRMSFYMDDPSNYVIVNPGNSNTTSYGGPLDLNLDGYYDYDPVEKKEYAYGEVEGDIYYKDPTQEDTEPAESDSTFIANHMHGVKQIDLERTSFKQENSRKLSEVSINIDEGQTSNKPLCILRKDEIQRVVVSIYIEGWDKHTIDSIQRASMDLNLLFAALYNI